MPNVIDTVSNLEASVERPVIFDVIRKVMDVTQISSKTPIRFYGDETKGPQKNSLIGDDGKGENRWNYDEKVVIEVDEDFERNRILSTAVKEAENQFIWRDSALDTAIKPVYASTEVTIRVRYRTRDKNQANRWRNEMRARASMMRGVLIHAISYHYEFPPKLIMLLAEIHRLREEIAPYGTPFIDYFTSNLTTKASTVSNLNGKEALWVVGETQGRVQGYFEFEGIPDKAEKEGEHDTFVSSFSYTFHYDKPIHCAMQYPIVIHQQLLDTKWRPAERPYKVTDILKTYTATSLAFSKFESDRQSMEIAANEGVDLPSYDEFLPSSIVPSTVRVMTALCCVTEDNKRDLFNFAELGDDFALDRDILEFIMKSEAPFMGRPYHSILCLSRYENRFLRSGEAVKVDAQGNVFAPSDLSLRTAHRVRLGLVTDLSLLTPDAKDRLKDWPKAGEKILDAINAAISDKGGQKDIGKNQIDPNELCGLGYHYHVDAPPATRSSLPPEPGTMLTSSIKRGPCNCGNYFDAPPVRPGRCWDPTIKRMNLVQTLFVATRPMTSLPKDLTNLVFPRTPSLP